MPSFKVIDLTTLVPLNHIIAMLQGRIFNLVNSANNIADRKRHQGWPFSPQTMKSNLTDLVMKRLTLHHLRFPPEALRALFVLISFDLFSMMRNVLVEEVILVILTRLAFDLVSRSLEYEWWTWLDRHHWPWIYRHRHQWPWLYQHRLIYLGMQSTFMKSGEMRDGLEGGACEVHVMLLKQKDEKHTHTTKKEKWQQEIDTEIDIYIDRYR